MEIDLISRQFYVTIDWSSIDQYQSVPINYSQTCIKRPCIKRTDVKVPKINSPVR